LPLFDRNFGFPGFARRRSKETTSASELSLATRISNPDNNKLANIEEPP
jgi:hypothetical protein